MALDEERRCIELEETKLQQRKRHHDLKTRLAKVAAEEEAIDSPKPSQVARSYRLVDNEVSFRVGHNLNPNALTFMSQVEPVEVNEVKSSGGKENVNLFEALQLPRLEAITFDGNPLKYWSFIRGFENSVERYCSEDMKLMRLMQSAVGKAREVIQCCCVMEPVAGFSRAKQLLKERFGNEYVITESWIKRITGFGNIKSNDRDKLREYSDDLNSCKETLKAMGKLNEINNQTNLLRIVEKLPVYVQNSWRKEARDIRVNKQMSPGIEDLTAFIQRAAEIANDPVFGNTTSVREEAPRQNEQRHARRYGEQLQLRNTNVNMSAVANSSQDANSHIQCPMCHAEHTLFRCDDFRRMKVDERLQFVRAKKLCDNCLRQGHKAAQCLKPTRCTVAGCARKHTKFLHILHAGPPRNGAVAQSGGQPREQISQDGDASRPAEVQCGLTGAGVGPRVSLPIVPVQVRVKGSEHTVRTCALLDSGSTNSFCSEELTELLGVKGETEAFTLTTLGRAGSMEEAQVVSLEISDINGERTFDMSKVYARRELPISVQNAATIDDVTNWSHLCDIQLPNLEGLKVMILIGQDMPDVMIAYETRQGPKGAPYAVRTPFGWTVNGPLGAVGDYTVLSSFISAEAKLDSQMERFWRLECSEMIASDEVDMSVNDLKATSIWNDTICLKQGHYEVAIPFKHSPPRLPDNRQIAEDRLDSLCRRLDRDPVLKTKYQAGIDDLLAKGYAEKVENNEVSNRAAIWYLPHHPVFHQKKPDKVRIVFDCAAKYAGTSLNDQVLQGPDLTNRLVGVLLRFRQEQVAVTADIESMFHQVNVVPEHSDALRFLWRTGDSESPPEVFRMKVHIFGGVWSPSCCNYVLRRTADDNVTAFSLEAVNTVRRNFYVDDCLKSVSSTDAAIELVKELCQLVAQGGFRLTKWLSNDRRVLQSIPEEEVVAEVRHLDLDNDSDDLPVEHVLGVLWNSESDTIGYEISVPERRMTRRGILSAVSSVYDPLGFISPFILPAKKMIQELCRRSISWDENLPSDILTSWMKWMEDLGKLNEISVPRCMKPQGFGEVENIQLHHFSDASVDGYGTVSYIRMVDEHGKIHCSILMAKSKLAPLKQITIPRLELSAAVLAVRIDQTLKRELDVSVDESVFWTDSTAVLKYIRNEDKRFHTFVANRLAVIHSGSVASQWHHVSTKLNPADHASRGMAAEQLVNNSQWFCGPSFLWQPKEEWSYELEVDEIIPADDKEVKKDAQAYFTRSSDDKEDICMLDDEFELKGSTDANANQSGDSDILTRLFERRSSWYELKKDVAHLLRVKRYLKNKSKKTALPDMMRQLAVVELQDAELHILKCVQGKEFSSEIAMSNQASEAVVKIGKSSQLYRLEPIMFEDRILRVGGRLPTHQIILPNRHHVTKLVIRHFHAKAGHSGKEHTLALIREQFWIVGARRAVSRELALCPVCRLRVSKPGSQRMADLPADRITPGDLPFRHVGADLFGPFVVKQGRSLVKRYGCLFTCLKIRAVHIEVLYSMDTDSFVNALQRFICRRGQVRTIRSDNGTNFVGANRELKAAIDQWNSRKIDDFLRQHNIQWKFNPPTASHMGGVWERQIRTVRKVLSSVMREQSLDQETLMTMFCLVESVINSRPLTAVSNDYRDLKPLSPNDLLLVGYEPMLPLGEFVRQDLYCKRRWRQVQYLADVFWRRWTREYLPTLQLRQKWLHPVKNLKVDDVVIVVDDGAPRNAWRLGRVTETYPSEDGLVRTAKVATNSGTLVRPIHKLCRLEFSDEQSMNIGGDDNA